MDETAELLFFILFIYGIILILLFRTKIFFLVLSVDNKAAVTSVNETMIPELCGANFLVNTATHEALPPQAPEKIQMITGNDRIFKFEYLPHFLPF